MNNDPINHPQHYNHGIETKDYIRSHDLNFNKGSAIKYVTRAGKKDASKEIEDLRKAITFIEFEIEHLEAEKSDGGFIRTRNTRNRGISVPFI